LQFGGSRGRRVAEEPTRIVVGILGINAAQLGAAVIFGRVYLESAEFAFATFAPSNGQRCLNINRDDDRVYKQPAFDGPERARARAPRFHTRIVGSRSVLSRHGTRCAIPFGVRRARSLPPSPFMRQLGGTKLTKVSSAITTTTTTTVSSRSHVWSTCFESR